MDIHRLVNVTEGTASREIFVDEAIFKRELEEVFARAWLFVGHEGQVPKPNDYYVSRMGQDSVILTRDQQGEIRVLLNSCRHRGMRLCRHDEGNTRLFTCPYHGWSYSTDGNLVSTPGELIGVPGYEKYYHAELDKRAWGLVSVPRMINHRGTIWASWDKDAPSFQDYMGGMLQWLDSALDHRGGREGGSTLFVGVQKWRANCNWKFPATNFVGDAGHGAPTHRSVNLAGISPSGGTGRRDERAPGHAAFAFVDLGHGGLGFLPRQEEEFPRLRAFQKYPHVSDYLYEQGLAHQKARAGRIHVQGKGTIFPNTSFHEDQPRTIIVHHPVSATVTEFWRYYIVDEDAPEAVKDTLRKYYLSYSGPGGMTEQDDLENWVSATKASDGAIARRYPYNYQQGLRWSEPCQELPGAIWCGHLVTEQNQLVWLKRWSEFMQGRNWDELMHRVPVPGDVPMPLKPVQVPETEEV